LSISGKIEVRGLPLGVGAGGLLVAAGIAAVVSVTAFVAFDDFPFSGDADRTGTITLGGNGPTAVSRDVGSAEAGAITVPRPSEAGRPSDAAGRRDGDAPRARRVDGPRGAGGGPDAQSSPQATGAPPAGAQAATEVTGTSPSIDQAVADLAATVVGGAAVEPDLGDPTAPATGALEDAIQGITHDGLGGQVNDLTAAAP
jgi:hypothetical protein